MDWVVGWGWLFGFDDWVGLLYVIVVVDELMWWWLVGLVGVLYFIKVESSYEGWWIFVNLVVILNYWVIIWEEVVFGLDVEVFVLEWWLGEEFFIVGFGYGCWICFGWYVVWNGLWIVVVWLLWVFDIMFELNELGVLVDVDIKGIDGLVMKLLFFKVWFVFRGSWVRDVVLRECDIWGVDYYDVFD